jgi:hypothetical protein
MESEPALTALSRHISWLGLPGTLLLLTEIATTESTVVTDALFIQDQL